MVIDEVQFECFISVQIQFDYIIMRYQSKGMAGQAMKLACILLLLTVIKSATVPPTAITTISGTFETGTAVLTTNNRLTSGSFTSQNTTVTFLNTYSTNPNFGYGFSYINAAWTTTTSLLETIIDVTPLSTTTASQTLQLNFTSSTITLFSINYVACATTFFLDVRTSLQDLSGTTIYSTSNSVRTRTLSLPMKSKSNSSNTISVYTTIGLSMMRTKNSFQYTLSTTGYTTSGITVNLAVAANNGMRFIRLAIFNYENIVITIDSPYFIDIGYGANLGGSISDSSNLGLSTTGTVFMGMTDWAISDSSSTILYNMSISGTTYSMDVGNTATRTQTGYLWYRQIVCPTYYYNSSNTCVSCHYSCLTCTSSTATSCSSCDSAASFRELLASNSSCPCKSNYIDSGVAICQQIVCPTNCESCSSDNVCSACKANSFRIVQNGSCVCQSYTTDYGDSTLFPQCHTCHPTCVTCFGFVSAITCLTCSSTKDYRTFNAATSTCGCMDGYYEISNLATTINKYLYVGVPCKECQYSCATCTTNTSCSSCSAALKRTINSATGYCKCMDGYYDNNLLQSCFSCPYSCSTCSSATVCLTCPQNRTLTNNQCPCSDGFFDVGVSACTACSTSCYTCTNITSCSSCNVNYYRTMSNGTCVCIGGYYDTYTSQICIMCDITCSTCSGGGSDKCTSCDRTKYRQLSLSKTCSCMSGYYNDGGLLLCATCYYTCATCTDGSTCLTCSALNHRTLSGGQCLCNNKYYDDGGNQLCKSCLYFCLTCSSSSACLTCDAATRNTTDLATCACLNGYYDDGISSSCQPCLASCATCTNANNCTTCVTNRQITSLATCTCVTRTFEPYCLACLYSCYSCLGTSSTCTSCNGTAMRYFVSSSSQCLCYQGYYDDGSNQLCATCHYSCLTCNTSNYCLTCPVNRQINGSYCSCINLYYENSTNLNCLSCHYSCATCSSYSVCTSCSSANFRTTSTSTTLCVCSNGYYDNGVSQICFACYSICQTCSAYSICTSCNSTQNFYYSNNTCLCNTGYYFNIATSSCVSCHYSCNSCTSSAACTTCKQNRTATSTYCTCNSGLFDNSVTQTCGSCTYPCVTCTGLSTTCTSCDSTRTLSSGSCVCTGSTYDTNLNCSSCLSTCQTCTNGSACLTCLTGSSRTLNTNNLCVCPTGYHDQNGTQLTCAVCHYSCTTCTNSVSCSTCYTGRTAVTNGYCICPTNFYYDNGVNGQCISCSYSCLTCSSISTNCTSCLSSTFRTLTNNACICQTGYYDDYTNAACQPCHYSCQQCTGGTSCSVCNSTNLRTYLTGPLCSCMTGYFDVSNVQLCSPCSYTCLTCITSTSICLTCASTRTFVNASSSCVCNDGLYDSGSSTCSSCLYSCTTCNSGTTCVTCSSTRLLNSFSQCQCKSGYYDISGVNQCASCHASCLTCSSFQTCTLCDTQNNFRQLVNTSCTCPSGYYDSSSSGNYTCQACPYSCATCVSSTLCSSCNLNYQRVYNITTGLCSCSPGYYDVANNAPCVACPYDCLTCSGATTCLTCSSSRYLDSNNRCACINSTYENGQTCQSCPTQCSTCTNSSFCTSCNADRILTSGACICPTGFYAVTGTATCSACHYSCSSCLSSTQCSTCNSTLLRYLTSTYCLCQSGYYDNGIQACQTCYYSCLLCSNGTTCLTCNSLNNRVLNLVTLLCDCVSGYYEDSTTKACIQCPYSCLTCTNGSACTSCNTNYNRALNASTNQCNCLEIGYFDTFISVVCSACDYTCYSCSSSATYCTSCLNTTYRTLSTSSCICSSGYYDVTNQAICLACSYRCVTCSAASTTCTSCSASNYRDVTPACSCITGYYDDGANSTCGKCNYVCETCTTSLVCTTCNLTVAHRSLNNITLLCDCIAQYYDNGIQICSSCSYSCQTCNNAFTCLTCPSTRSLTSNQCLCLAKYYDDLINLQCQSCNYTCQTCQNSSSCFSCNSANKRTFNSSTYLCSCMTNYYDVGVQLCSRCDLSCQTCTEAASCSTCPPNINKVLNSTAGSSYCVCLYGYYENVTAGVSLGYNSICSACYYACQTCTGQSTYCTLCSTAANRYLTTSYQCACKVGYFEQAGQKTCFPCYTNCLTCTGVNSNNCLTCDNTTYYLSNSCYTTCPSFYNISSSTRTCVSCPSNCLSCPASLTVCSSCNSPYFIFATNSSYSQCVLSCPSYYYELNKTCYSCNSPCLSCTAAYTCTSCINLYYLKDGYCNPCHSLCLTCSGSTALDCITCVSNYVLVGTVCQKLNCLSTQYVQSVSGCVNCTTTFPNSLTCLSTGPTSCLNGYILSNNSCVTCSGVTGYVYDSSTGKCKDYCGDKIIITDLCDDGNTLNGDGCSSVCTIETGWICPSNVCSLKQSPTVSLVSLTNRPHSHSLVVILSLSVGLRLVDANFILNFSSITQFTYTSSALNIYYDRYQLIIVYYQTAQDNYLNIKIKSPASRLLVTSSTQLSVSISLSISVPVQTSPPAIYTTQTQSKVYSEYLYGVLAALHIVLVIFTIIFLFMKLKIMLLIIDSFNSITIVYILAALGLYNVSLLSFQTSRSLQPFIYQFGSPLLDQTTNFYYFNYTSNYFSSTIVQALVIAATYILSVIFSRKQSTQDNVWYYYRAAFMFAFAYDFLLASFSTFFWNTYSSYESSYSWMFAILALMYIGSETVLYYGRMRDYGEGKKVVPAISFITNDLQIRDKTKQETNIFQIEQQNFKERKPSKGILSEWSDEKTEVLGQTGPKTTKSTEAVIMYYDLSPSAETQYSSKARNHISVTHLPIMCILFGFLYSIIANVQETKVRSIFFLILSILYLAFVIFFPSQSLKRIRNIKLIVLSSIYVVLSIMSVILSTNPKINYVSSDIVIVTFVILAVVFNIVVFVISVFKSDAYREYLINKKNEQILQRTKKQNQARQKIYTKTDMSKEKSKKPKGGDISEVYQHPESFQVKHPQIQPTEQQPEQKEFKLIDFKKNIARDQRTMMHVRDSSSIINRQIDNQISDMRDSDLPHHQLHGDFLNEKNIFDIKQSAADSFSPSKKIKGSRAKAINNSQMSLVEKKGDASSLFFDSSLDKVEQIRGIKRNLKQQHEKEQVQVKQTKKSKRKKKPKLQTDVVNNDQFYEKEDDLPKSKFKYYEEEKKQSVEDILDELEMPYGFKKSEDSNFRARILSIDEISSIKEEREQFMSHQKGSEYEGSVFNKILQDYKKYRHKKVDKKKLKELKGKKI